MDTPAADSEPRKKLRVRVRPDLAVAAHRYEGRTYYVVKDPVSLRYYRYSEQEHFLIRLLDGSAVGRARGQVGAGAVPGDGEQPGGEALGVLQALEGAERSHERLLDDVVHLVAVQLRERGGDPLHGRPVTAVELLLGLATRRTFAQRPGNQLGVRQRTRDELEERSNLAHDLREAEALGDGRLGRALGEDSRVRVRGGHGY